MGAAGSEAVRMEVRMRKLKVVGWMVTRLVVAGPVSTNDAT